MTTPFAGQDPNQGLSTPSRWWVNPAVGVLLLVLILYSAPVYGRLTSGGKISAAIDRSMERVDVEVQLPFQAEAFHRERLAEHGVYGGRVQGDGSRLRIRAVTSEDLEALANLYWVASIDPDRS